MSSEPRSFEDKVRRARERLDRPAAKDPPVQLAVRLPVELRDRVHRAAAAAGSASTQEWLQGIVASAVDDALDPQRRVAARLRESLIATLVEQIEDGRYEDVIAAIAADDPDVA